MGVKRGHVSKISSMHIKHHSTYFCLSRHRLEDSKYLHMLISK